MGGFLVRWIINIIALLAVAHIIPGIDIGEWDTTIVAALIIGLINTFLKPLVILFTLPVSIFTLGIFTLFINGFMFYMASKIVAGFKIVNFWHAFWGALVFSIISFLLNLLITPQGRADMHFYRRKL